jgi:molybdopterin synthase sulfur carrier subunit
MQVHIIIFGQLTDIMGSRLALDNIADTDNLIAVLNKSYPALTDKKYIVAVDKEVITKNTSLTHNSIVALLPPFSGG